MTVYANVYVRGREAALFIALPIDREAPGGGALQLRYKAYYEAGIKSPDYDVYLTPDAAERAGRGYRQVPTVWDMPKTRLEVGARH